MTAADQALRELNAFTEAAHTVRETRRLASFVELTGPAWLVRDARQQVAFAEHVLKLLTVEPRS
jgi:hypothetical protein